MQYYGVCKPSFASIPKQERTAAIEVLTEHIIKSGLWETSVLRGKTTCSLRIKMLSARRQNDASLRISLSMKTIHHVTPK